MDTPVSGGVAAAQAGTLPLCAVSSEAFARAVTVLEAMGNREKIFHAGGDGAGQVAKAANNMLLAIQMIGTCEALALGAANGLDPAVQSEIMKASSGNNWPLQVYNPWPGVMPTAPRAMIIDPASWLISWLKTWAWQRVWLNSPRCRLTLVIGHSAFTKHSKLMGWALKTFRL